MAEGTLTRHPVGVWFLGFCRDICSSESVGLSSNLVLNAVCGEGISQPCLHPALKENPFRCARARLDGLVPVEVEISADSTRSLGLNLLEHAHFAHVRIANRTLNAG